MAHAALAVLYLLLTIARALTVCIAVQMVQSLAQ
jgi:hypothetical protein